MVYGLLSVQQEQGDQYPVRIHQIHKDTANSCTVFFWEKMLPNEPGFFHQDGAKAITANNPMADLGNINFFIITNLIHKFLVFVFQVGNNKQVIL